MASPTGPARNRSPSSTKLASAAARPGRRTSAPDVDRLAGGQVHGAVGIPSAEQVDAGHGEAMVDGRPREPVRRQIDRRRGETIERQPSGCGEREVAGWCRRRSDRRRPGVAPRTGAGDVGETAGRATDGEQRLGARRPARADDGDEVAAEAALRRQQHRLGERRRDRRVEGVAAVPQRRGPGLGGERCGGAHDPVGPAPGALLGHHRDDGVTAHVSLPMRASERSRVSGHGRPAWPGDASAERARSGCARRATGRPATRAAAPRWPGRGGRTWCHRPPCRSESHGTTATAWQPSGEAITTSSSTRKVNPSIAGQTLRHCCVLELVEAVDDLGVGPEGRRRRGRSGAGPSSCRRRRPRRPTRRSSRAPSTRSTQRREGLASWSRKYTVYDDGEWPPSSRGTWRKVDER